MKGCVFSNDAVILVGSLTFGRMKSRGEATTVFQHFLRGDFSQPHRNHLIALNSLERLEPCNLTKGNVLQSDKCHSAI